jgi:hypothetical protein
MERRMLLKGFGATLFLATQKLGAKELPNDNPSKTVNVLNFGAKPEPTYDNFKHIQDAIDDLKVGGGEVHFPGGIFGINFENTRTEDGESGLRIHDNISIIGSPGRNRTVLNVIGGTKIRTHVFQNKVSNFPSINISVRDLQIDCNYTGTKTKTDARINGITFKNALNVSVENCSVNDGMGYGIWLHNTKHSKIRLCKVRDFQDGIELSGESRNNIVEDNIVSSTGKAQWISNLIILFLGASHNIIQRNSLIGSAGSALSVVSGYGHGNNNLFFENFVDVKNTVGIYCSGENNFYISNSISTEAAPAVLFYEAGSSRNTVLLKNSFVGRLSNAPDSRRAALVFTEDDELITLNDNNFLVSGGSFFSRKPRGQWVDTNTLKFVE